jgi:hypothetical protein
MSGRLFSSRFEDFMLLSSEKPKDETYVEEGANPFDLIWDIADGTSSSRDDGPFEAFHSSDRDWAL